MSSTAGASPDPADLERRRARTHDRRLAGRVARGEDAAFFELHERHRPALLGFARQIVGDTHDAEDVVQQSMIRAYQALRSGQSPDHVRAWLYTITRNRACTLLASRAGAPVPEGEPQPVVWSPGADDAALRRADLRALLDDLALLPEQQRTALVLTEVSGMPQRRIAEVLGVAENRVGGLVFQARRTLAADRAARLTPCEEIREQLAVARGPELRRGPLRRHLRQCPACRRYRREVDRQQQGLALLLPAVAMPGLREAAAAGAAGAAALAAPQPLVVSTGVGVGEQAAGFVVAALKSLSGGSVSKATLAVVASTAVGAGAVSGVTMSAAEPPTREIVVAASGSPAGAADPVALTSTVRARRGGRSSPQRSRVGARSSPRAATARRRAAARPAIRSAVAAAHTRWTAPSPSAGAQRERLRGPAHGSDAVKNGKSSPRAPGAPGRESGRHVATPPADQSTPATSGPRDATPGSAPVPGGRARPSRE